MPGIFGINEPLIFGLPVNMPVIISRWLGTGSWTGSVLQIFELLLGILIYYPFVKMLNKQYFPDEQVTAEAELTMGIDEV